MKRIFVKEPTLTDLINETIHNSFQPDYRDKQTQATGMGLLMSHHFEWNGLEILEASADALEDANFHHEAAIVRELLAVNQR